MAAQDPTDFASVTGKGVTRHGRRPQRWRWATRKLMADLGRRAWRVSPRRPTSCAATARRRCSWRSTARPGGVIAIADPIKATTQAALDSLRADGVRIVMLTGDNRTTAEAVARKLGIDDVAGRRAAGGQAPHRPRAAQPKGASSPWRATA